MAPAHIIDEVFGPLGIDYAKLELGDEMPEGYAKDDPVLTKAERRCGILLHPSSLPGPDGIGDLGEEVFRFLDWLQGTGCSVWQVLPLVPPGRRGGEDGSPYAGADANCGNTLLISLRELAQDGLLQDRELPLPAMGQYRAIVDLAAVARVKDPLIAKAAENLAASTGALREAMEAFRSNSGIASWLEDAALFAAVDQEYHHKSINCASSWWEWPEEVRDRHPDALATARTTHRKFITRFVAEQFLFQRQWERVHRYATACGIRIVGDMPIYVGAHSGDVWANRRMFELDATTGAPTTSRLSGVPPDQFSPHGQLWGSPLYNWKEMANNHYAWWATRMKRAFHLYDEVRIDHFRGLAAFWAVDAASPTAVTGKWIRGPGPHFFTTIHTAVGRTSSLPIIVEDLGIVTPDVVNLRRRIKAPGMAVLQFAFTSDSSNPHLPHNLEVDTVVYTGTHDNDTTVGWWSKLEEAEREAVRRYLRFAGDDDVHWELIRCAVATVARTAVIPMQDVLGLGGDARMNTPATVAGNWGWRVGDPGFFSQLETETTRLQECLKLFNRFSRHCNLLHKQKLPPAYTSTGVAANGNS